MIINIGRKEAVFFGVVILVLTIVGFGVAYGGNQPDVMGHSAEELEGVCLSDGTNCPFMGDFVPSDVSGWSGTGAKKMVYPNGLIMYFGYATSKTIDVSAAGFTEVFNVQITPRQNPSASSYYAPRVNTFTTSTIIIYNYGIAAAGYYYTVIGR